MSVSRSVGLTNFKPRSHGGEFHVGFYAETIWTLKAFSLHPSCPHFGTKPFKKMCVCWCVVVLIFLDT